MKNVVYHDKGTHIHPPIVISAIGSSFEIPLIYEGDMSQHTDLI